MFAEWDMLPAAVYPVATRARSRDSAAGAHALERAVDGRWVMIEAGPLEDDHEGCIASRCGTRRPRRYSTCSPARMPSVGPSVTWSEAFSAGSTPRAITESLFISRQTVHDHLKSVFEKIGIHSRRELLATFNIL
jgi:hypothetical protein